MGIAAIAGGVVVLWLVWGSIRPKDYMAGVVPILVGIYLVAQWWNGGESFECPRCRGTGGALQDETSGDDGG